MNFNKTMENIKRTTTNPVDKIGHYQYCCLLDVIPSTYINATRTKNNVDIFLCIPYLYVFGLINAMRNIAFMQRVASCPLLITSRYYLNAASITYITQYMWYKYEV